LGATGAQDEHESDNEDGQHGGVVADVRPAGPRRARLTAPHSSPAPMIASAMPAAVGLYTWLSRPWTAPDRCSADVTARLATTTAISVVAYRRGR
jgi:hypothetical protein